MNELKTEKKREVSQTHTKAKSIPEKLAKHDFPKDYLGQGFQPPERTALLLSKLSHSTSSSRRERVVSQLQQTYGNRYVQRALQVSEKASEGQSEGPNAEPQQVLAVPPAPGLVPEGQPEPEREGESPTEGAEIASTAGEGLLTVLKPDRSPRTVRGVITSQPGEAETAQAIVRPSGGPTIGAGSNDCVPTAPFGSLSWNIVPAGLLTWRPNVRSLTLSGRLRIRPWPSQPNRMVVPNTPNPVDGGNINNTPASDNYWQAAINDMADYDTAGGGAGPHWHATAASRAHEWAHWNEDWVADSVNSARGGNWPAVNRAIESLRETSLTILGALVALQLRVNALVAGWRTRAVNRWNTLIHTTDSPGGGGRGYAAGTLVLRFYITWIRIYRFLKGW